ncbi:S-antigen protein-like [Choloepus didactylus]|uniref:S-antigen protein-like n=1 Tax=Choloepus didactylus TaxID=27675 RepID=UPI00189E0511|nr:S-antigen protein-like [Choloepus didactylus]
MAGCAEPAGPLPPARLTCRKRRPRGVTAIPGSRAVTARGGRLSPGRAAGHAQGGAAHCPRPSLAGPDPQGPEGRGGEDAGAARGRGMQRGQSGWGPQSTPDTHVGHPAPQEQHQTPGGASDGHHAAGKDAQTATQPAAPGHSKTGATTGQTDKKDVWPGVTPRAGRSAPRHTPGERDTRPRTAAPRMAPEAEAPPAPSAGQGDPTGEPRSTRPEKGREPRADNGPGRRHAREGSQTPARALHAPTE